MVSNLVSVARNISKIIEPINGIRDIKNHHPERLVSCNLRTVTAKLGINKPSITNEPNITASKTIAIIEKTN